MVARLARPRCLAIDAGAATVGAVIGRIGRDYRRDIAAAQGRLDAVARKYVGTPFGTVEYAESGIGEPVLVSHGIFHGCDGGLLSVRDTGGQHPGAIVPGQALADQVAQVQSGGAALEPGMVPRGNGA
jgi:hypothetical protein